VDHLGWEWIFFVNIPIGVIGVVLAVWLIPALPTHPHRFDVLGVVLSGVGLFLIVFGLQEGQTHGWAPWIWAVIAGGIGVIVSLQQDSDPHIQDLANQIITYLEDVTPAEVLAKLKPEYVTPAVVYLVSDEAPTGVVMTAGAGAFAQARIYETEGVYLGEGGLSVEEVRDNFARITDPTGQQAYVNGGEQSGKFFRKMQGG
jgi:MFS family permease